jgi:hypothetical protein
VRCGAWVTEGSGLGNKKTSEHSQVSLLAAEELWLRGGLRLGMVIHACNPSTFGGSGRRIMSEAS